MAQAVESVQARGGLLSVPAVSWSLYDFANTIFSYVVVTRYFNDWIIEQRGVEDIWVGAMSFVVALALVVSLPLFGAVADRWGRRKPFLVGFTLLAVVPTATLGSLPTVALALLVAGLAIFAYNNALAHYDPLLAQVAPPDRRGRVSGLGVALGYVGVLFVFAFFALTDLVPAGENERAFFPAAALFLVFSLPCFFLVRERGAARPLSLEPALARDALGDVVRTVREAARQPVGRFLLARFLYVDAIATVIAFMVVYARRNTSLTDEQLNILLPLAVGSAVLGAFAAGALVERLGPKRVLVGILLAFAATLALQGITGAGVLIWIAGPIVGISLGGVWTSDRVFLLRLSPEEKRGELFGLYALAGKLSSGIGPFVLWGGTIFLLSGATDIAGKPAASRVALVVLAAATLAGVLVLRPVSDRVGEGRV
jgi:UMF1 family MFS transporter